MPKTVIPDFKKIQLRIISPVIFSKYFFSISPYFIAYYKTLHLAIIGLILAFKLKIILQIQHSIIFENQN